MRAPSGPFSLIMVTTLLLSACAGTPSGPPSAPDSGRDAGSTSDLVEAAPLLCQPGSASCDGSRVVRCSESGREWLVVEQCQPGQLCHLGECRDHCASSVKAIVSFGTPWRGSPLADNVALGAWLATLLRCDQAVQDLKPAQVTSFLAGRAICAPRYGVGGTVAGVGLAGECLVGWLALKQAGYPQNDGLVPLESALPGDVTSLGSYPLDHLRLIRDVKPARDVAHKIKALLGITAPGQYKVLLINGLTGGHQISPEALQVAVDEFGAENLFFCPTDDSLEMSFLPVGDKQVLVVGTRGFLSAGLEPVESQSEFIVKKISALKQLGLVKADDKLLLVGHSMGGLAAYGATFLLENGLARFPK